MRTNVVSLAIMSNSQLFSFGRNKYSPTIGKIMLCPNRYPMKPLPLRIRLMLCYGVGNGPRSSPLGGDLVSSTSVEPTSEQFELQAMAESAATSEYRS